MRMVIIDCDNDDNYSAMMMRMRMMTVMMR
jgi:hypothetical protein